MALVVGLTGGIGSGKSSAGKIFMELGIDVIDTDQISHELTQSGGAAIPAIRSQFGDEFIAVDGALDRIKMRQLVFSDNHQRSKLEALLHPLILKETTRRIHQYHSPYIIVAIPLLFETDDYNHLIQRTLVIDCDEHLQITRTIARSNLSAEEVKAIMASQVSRWKRLEMADDIIINNQTIDHLRAQITELHKTYLSLSKKIV